MLKNQIETTSAPGYHPNVIFFLDTSGRICLQKAPKTVFASYKASDPHGSRAAVCKGQLYTSSTCTVLNANQQEQENSLILKPTPRSYSLGRAYNLTVQLQQLHGRLLPLLADTVSVLPVRSHHLIGAGSLLSV